MTRASKSAWHLQQQGFKFLEEVCFFAKEFEFELREKVLGEDAENAWAAARNAALTPLNPLPAPEATTTTALHTRVFKHKNGIERRGDRVRTHPLRRPATTR